MSYRRIFKKKKSNLYRNITPANGLATITMIMVNVTKPKSIAINVKISFLEVHMNSGGSFDERFRPLKTSLGIATAVAKNLVMRIANRSKSISEPRKPDRKLPSLGS